MEEILHKIEIIKEYFLAGKIGIVGAMYNVETGQVDFFKTLIHQPAYAEKLVAVH